MAKSIKSRVSFDRLWHTGGGRLAAGILMCFMGCNKIDWYGQNPWLELEIVIYEHTLTHSLPSSRRK